MAQKDGKPQALSLTEKRISKKKKKLRTAPGLSGEESAAELKAMFRDQIRNWYLGRHGLSNLDYPLPWFASTCAGTLTFYRDTGDKVLKVISTDDIIDELIDASLQEAPLWGPDFSWDAGEASRCLSQVKSQVTMRRVPDCFVSEDDIKPIRWHGEEGFCFYRMPFEKHLVEGFDGHDLRSVELGRFMRTMIEHAPDYDKATGRSLGITRLLCWLGVVLLGDDSPKEMLVIVSGGNDGKTTFLEAVQENLGGGDVVKLGEDIEAIADKHQKVQILNKRVFHFEEPKSGHLISAALKRVVGSQVVEGRFLHKNSINFRNRACFVVTTNNFPKIDGSRAHKARLRMLRLGEIPKAKQSAPEDAKRDLQEHWEQICRAAITAAIYHGLKIPENTQEELDESTSDFYVKVDSLIADVLCEEEGAFMPVSLLAELCDKHRVSVDDLKKRLVMTFPILSWEKGRIPRDNMAMRRIAPVWGFKNLGLLPGSWAWGSENWNRKYKKSCP